MKLRKKACQDFLVPGASISDDKISLISVQVIVNQFLMFELSLETSLWHQKLISEMTAQLVEDNEAHLDDNRLTYLMAV